MPGFVSAQNINVVRKGRRIINDVSFEVPSGSWIGIIGPNGSGKTTLLKTIGGLLPYQGSLRLSDMEIRDTQPKNLARYVAFVYQKLQIEFDYSVFEMVLLGRLPHKKAFSAFTKTDQEFAHLAIERVDLLGFEKRIIHQLSGGEQQRVMLAQAIVQDTPLLLLDEPTSHLDIGHQYSFLELIKSFVQYGKTIVSVFHNLEIAAKYVDYLYVLNDGRICDRGLPEKVISEEMIARVFKMRSTVSSADSQNLSIRFLAPINNHSNENLH